jgi:hypothetical protein
MLRKTTPTKTKYKDLFPSVRSPATVVVGGRAIVGSWHMWHYRVVPSHVVCGRAGRDGNLARSLCQTTVVRPCLQSEHGDAKHGLLLFDVPNFDGEGVHHLRQLIKLLRQTNNGVCRFRARTCAGGMVAWPETTDTRLSPDGLSRRFARTLFLRLYRFDTTGWGPRPLRRGGVVAAPRLGGR